MKKSERVVFAIVAVVVVFAGIVSMVISLRSRALAEREPFTLEELDQLASKLELMASNEPLQPVQTEDAADPGSDEPVGGPVPARLNRAPTPEILTERFANNPEHRREHAIRAEMMKVVESILWTVGAEAKDWTRGVGRGLLWGGKWDGARRYLYETLRTTDSSQRFMWTCAELAWLEQDPTKAARLLELSLQGDDEWLSVQIELAHIPAVSMVMPTRRIGIDSVSFRAMLLANAVDLTGATGSDVLENHYLEWLRVESPELARNFDEESDREDR